MNECSTLNNPLVLAGMLLIVELLLTIWQVLFSNCTIQLALRIQPIKTTVRPISRVCSASRN